MLHLACSSCAGPARQHVAAKSNSPTLCCPRLQDLPRNTLHPPDKIPLPLLRPLQDLPRNMLPICELLRGWGLLHADVRRVVVSHPSFFMYRPETIEVRAAGQWGLAEGWLAAEQGLPDLFNWLHAELGPHLNHCESSLHARPPGAGAHQVAAQGAGAVPG